MSPTFSYIFIDDIRNAKRKYVFVQFIHHFFVYIFLISRNNDKEEMRKNTYKLNENFEITSNMRGEPKYNYLFLWNVCFYICRKYS